MTTVSQIIRTLQRELHLAGIALLRDVAYPKFDGQDMMVTCPYHKNGQENKPSCGITTRQKRRGNKVIPSGTVHCFVCHKTVGIEELVGHCFDEDRDFGVRWILDHFGNFEVENRVGALRVPSRQKQEEKKVEYVSEEELSKYRFFHPYMYKRYLTDEQIDFFDIGVDIKGGNITFPVKDMDGNVLFVAKRSIKGKRFYIPPTVKDKPLCYLYEAKKLYPDSTQLYICESMFNALTLLRFVPAIALLGTGSHGQIEKLKNLPYRRYVLCLDNDEAGLNGIKKLMNELGTCKFISVMLPKDETKDINDLGYAKTFEELEGDCNYYSGVYNL
jgi:DNA primase